MIRLLNFAFIAITSLVCLGVYRVAEEARVDEAQLGATRAALIRESDALTVLGAEWARLTQPARIQALTERHLDLSDQPAVELSSLTDLPLKNAPAPEDAIRTAKAVVPQAAPEPAPRPAPVPAPEVNPAPAPDVSFASLHTGT
jgi:hypothetical protein